MEVNKGKRGENGGKGKSKRVKGVKSSIKNGEGGFFFRI